MTANPDRSGSFGGLVAAARMDFLDPDGLFRSCREPGYCTAPTGYGSTAGVGRTVHFSVANASAESRLSWFRDKGQVEETQKGSGLSYAIIGPTLVFGEGDLLLNNMAWALRRFPVFPVFGRGDYRLQPVYAGDLAAQAVDAGALRESFVADAAGPETFTFEELLRLLALAVNARVRLVHMPPSLRFTLTRLVGLLLRDVELNRDEVDGLMAGLLTSAEPPAGTTTLAGWLEENPDILGRQYVSEFRRNYRR